MSRHWCVSPITRRWFLKRDRQNMGLFWELKNTTSHGSRNITFPIPGKTISEIYLNITHHVFIQNRVGKNLCCLPCSMQGRQGGRGKAPYRRSSYSSVRRPAVSKEIWGKQRRTSLKWLPSKGGSQWGQRKSCSRRGHGRQ